jgi:hypothetical protein
MLIQNFLYAFKFGFDLEKILIGLGIDLTENDYCSQNNSRTYKDWTINRQTFVQVDPVICER